MMKMRLLSLCGLCLLPAFGQDTSSLKIGAAGWIQTSRFVQKDTSFVQGIDKLSQYAYGSQVSLSKQVNPKLGIHAGMGIFVSHSLAYSDNNGGGYAPLFYSPYPSVGYLDYSILSEGPHLMSMKLGLFPYDYAENNRNLGLYLLRGPVYPGFLLSGFETKHVLPIANMLGVQLHHEWGGFSQDLILNSEQEFFPYYDISPAYLAFYKNSFMRIGAGVNFYHLVAIDDTLTTNPIDFYVDTTGGGSDTTQLSFKGTKLMAMGSLDLKALFGSESTAEDWKIYGEVAIIGLKNTKAYQELYGDLLHRMPMMLGINLPTFGYADVFSFEAEWYGAPFADDITKYTSHTSGRQDPLPNNPVAGKNYRRDNWKWSAYLSKVYAGHIKLSGQVANDHSRPGNFKDYGDNNPPEMKSPFSSLQNWYMTGKVAYFF